MLAGTLEKRARWRKEWRSRFCVMRHDRIDYYLQTPAIVDDGNCEQARGSISLYDAAAVEEPGRPHCIRVGDVLLSCRSHAEQQRWLSTILGATNQNPSSSARPQRHSISDGPEEPPLLLLLPDGLHQTLPWHEATTVAFPAGEVAVTVLFLDASGSSGSSGSSAESHSARALCRLRLSDIFTSEATFPVEPLMPLREGMCRSATYGRALRIRVHANKLPGTLASRSPLFSPAPICLCAALAFLTAGSLAFGKLLVLVGLFLLITQHWWSRTPHQRRLTFSVERLESNAPLVQAPLGLSSVPLWVGRWRLDKACSEKYEPILIDMGVNYLLRKAADAVKSALIISVTSSHVTIHVKTLVAVEDCIPLDGSWTTKPVPPGGRMKGQLRVRLTKVNTSELEMYSEFPDGEGDLRDTLTVHQDGNSFTRKVVRGELSVTRVFRRE